MGFCSNCGNQLEDGAKFCSECGKPVGESNVEARQVFKGKIQKCPNCGEVLKAFDMSCPSCGYELRGAKATESISALEIKLEKAASAEEKADIIRHFPIPNTKEDLWEFLILASTNADERMDSVISSVWVVKIEQVIQKARLIIKDKDELNKIEEQYQAINKRLRSERKIRSAKKIGSTIAELTPVLPQVIAVTGWLISIFILLPLCRVDQDYVGANASQLLLFLDFIAGAVFVPFVLRKNSVLPKLIVTCGLLLSIFFVIPLCRSNDDYYEARAFQLIFIVELICCVIIFLRSLKYDRKVHNSITVPNGAALLISFVCVLVFVAVYGIGTLMLPKAEPSYNESPSITEDAETDESQGIYSYEIRDYVGKNLASVGEVYGSSLTDEYGSGKLNVIIVTEDGMLVPIDDNEIKKGYTVVDQNIAAGTNVTMVHSRNSRGEPYSNMVDYQSFDEIVLYVSPVGESGYSPQYTTIEPTLDKHSYHIRDYVGRNAASFGEDYSSKRNDEYGPAKLKLVFTSEDGSYVDSEDINELKQYVITGQDIEPNKELKLDYEINSRGKEYEDLIKNQNYEEINLTVSQLDAGIIDRMPVLEDKSSNNGSKHTELTIKYKVDEGGNAVISGFSGDGNHATIDRKIDGHEVVSIGKNAFKDCTTLESVLFWADVESIGDYAFAGCTSLKKISIPNETTYIGKHAFDGCTDLSDLIIWGNPEIEDYAFTGCESIKSVSISSDTKRIGSHAFDGCKNLESVLIWGDDTVVEKDAFANCPKLKDRPVQE